MPTKLNPAGSALVYSTFLGGSGFDSAMGLAVDAGGNAYVAGGTGSADFPTTAGAFDTTSGGGFITKLNSSRIGTGVFDLPPRRQRQQPSSSTAPATRGSRGQPALISRRLPMHSTPRTTAWPTPSSRRSTRLDRRSSSATFLGGTQSDVGNGIGFDPGGNAIVVGHTYSTDFPTTAGAFDRVWNGDMLIFWGDAFVAKVATGAAPPPPPPPPPPSAPAAPTLNSPANGATVTLPVTLDWNDVTNATSYTVQVDDSSGFTSPLVVQQSVTASQASVSGLANVQHWWRVQAVNASGTSAWSAVRTFTPTSGGGGSGPLPAPSLLSPPADARFSRGTSITFDWTDVTGAASYTIQIDDSQSFSAPLIVQQTTTASNYVTSTLPARRMWFRVRANSAAGAPGTWSASQAIRGEVAMTHVARLLICFVVAGLTAAAASLSTGEPPSAAGSPVLPIDFIENKGQWEHGTRFVARGSSVSARFERDTIVLRDARSRHPRKCRWCSKARRPPPGSPARRGGPGATTSTPGRTPRRGSRTSRRGQACSTAGSTTASICACASRRAVSSTT